MIYKNYNYEKYAKEYIDGYLKNQFKIDYNNLDKTDKQQLHYMFPAHSKNYVGVEHAVQNPAMFLDSYFTKNGMFRIDISKRGLANSDEMILYLFTIYDMTSNTVRFSVEFRENIKFMQYSEYIYFLNLIKSQVLYSTIDNEYFAILHHKYYRDRYNLSMINTNYLFHTYVNTFDSHISENGNIIPMIKNPKICIRFNRFKSRALSYDTLTLSKIKRMESTRKMDASFELRLSVREMVYGVIPFLNAAAIAFNPEGLKLNGYGALTEDDTNRKNTYYNNATYYGNI